MRFRLAVSVALLLSATCLTAQEPGPFAIQVDAAVARAAPYREIGVGFALKFPDIGGTRWSGLTGVRLFVTGHEVVPGGFIKPDVAEFSLETQFALWKSPYACNEYGCSRNGAPRSQLYLFAGAGIADVQYPTVPGRTPIDLSYLNGWEPLFTAGYGVRWHLSPSVAPELRMGYQWSSYAFKNHHGLTAGLSVAFRP